MDEPYNLFDKPLTKEEKIDLNDALHKFIVSYENEFWDVVNDDDDREEVMYEFKNLYNIAKKLEDKACEDEEE